MTFSLYPEDDAPPQPEIEPAKRRRVLIWAGARPPRSWRWRRRVGWSSATTGRVRTQGNGSVVMPAAPDDPLTASPDGTDSAAPSASASAGRSVPPSHSGSTAAPTGGPGTPAPGLPVSYRVTSTLCPAVDFTPLSGLAGSASGGPEDQQKDYGESGYTDYSCLQRYGSGSANIQAEIFGSPASAGSWYDTTRANATGPADVAGVGTAAFEYLATGDQHRDVPPVGARREPRLRRDHPGQGRQPAEPGETAPAAVSRGEGIDPEAARLTRRG